MWWLRSDHRSWWRCNGCATIPIVFAVVSDPVGQRLFTTLDEIQRVSSTFVTRTHRKPRTTPADELPVLIGAADLQVYKRDPASSPLILCNGGLHFHGLLLVPPDTRLKVPVDEHFREYQDMYIGRRGLITRQDVRPVDETPEQVVDFMLERMAAGDFYILCPDNDVTREMDEKRMLWAAEDIIENRPALSRWHPDYKEAFARFMQASRDRGA